MLKRTVRLPARVARWLLRRPGCLFLLAGDERLASEPPSRFRYAWLESLIASLAWSLVSVSIWGAAWAMFGEPVGRPMPACLVAATFVLWPYRRAVRGGLEMVFPSDATLRSVGGAVFVLVLTLALLSLRPDWRKDSELPQWLIWIRPWEKVYRPMVLMPLWGAWAMFVAPHFCRARQVASPAVAVFAAGCSPLLTASVMGLLLALTATYYNFLGGWQLPIAACGAGSAIIAGVVFCRLEGGLTRRALLAANVVTQLVFLLACLATCNLVYW